MGIGREAHHHRRDIGYLGSGCEEFTLGSVVIFGIIRILRIHTFFPPYEIKEMLM